MDTLAALALATERPQPSIINSPPTRKGDTVLTVFVWRSIYGMSAYIILVMTFLIFFGEYMWEDTSYLTTDGFNNAVTGEPNGRMKHFTFIFNTFVFMTLFNEINCRKVGARTFNVFSHILSNWMFLAVISAVAAF